MMLANDLTWTLHLTDKLYGTVFTREKQAFKSLEAYNYFLMDMSGIVNYKIIIIIIIIVNK